MKEIAFIHELKRGQVLVRKDFYEDTETECVIVSFYIEGNGIVEMTVFADDRDVNSVFKGLKKKENILKLIKKAQYE